MKLTLFSSALAALISLPVSAITITFDYTHDMANSNFFGTNATAKAALEAAGADLSAAITSSLGAVSSSSFTGTNGLQAYNIDWQLGYTNPSTGAAETLSSFSLAADEIRIFAGARTLAGSTLGQGGPGGAGYSAGGAYNGVSGSCVPSLYSDAVNNAVTASNAAMDRNSLVTIGGFSSSTSCGATTVDFDLNYGPTIGNIWFDDDSTWHYDHTTAVTAGASDFYSVALHELIHAVGIGTYDSWDALLAGSGDPKDWTGANAIAEYGSGISIIDGNDDSHIENGIMSTRISDGVMQEVVMDPNITVGTRKTLTDLDLAFLEDLGWETTWVIPEPSSSSLLALALLGLVTQRRRQN